MPIVGTAEGAEIEKPVVGQTSKPSGGSSKRAVGQSEIIPALPGASTSLTIPVDLLQNLPIPVVPAPTETATPTVELGAVPVTDDGSDLSQDIGGEPLAEAKRGERVAVPTRSFAPAEIATRRFTVRDTGESRSRETNPELKNREATPLLRADPQELKPSAIADAVETLSPLENSLYSEKADKISAAAVIPPVALAGAPDVEKKPLPRREKIAAGAEKISRDRFSAETALEKTFLSTDSEPLVKQAPNVGTDVAKSGIDMFDHSSNHSAALVAPHAASLVAHEAGMAEKVVEKSFAPEMAGAAQRAVEAVLTAADRMSSGDRHMVNLHFSVGGNDLVVRVELRADEVHATFQTDSAELRSALAQEWHTVNSGTEADRALHFASPVFTGNSNQSASSNLSSFSGGEGSSRHQQQEARRAADESFAVIAGIRAARATSDLASESVTTSALGATRPTSSTTAGRLLAHA